MISDLISAAGVIGGAGAGVAIRVVLRKLDERRGDEPPQSSTTPEPKPTPRPRMHVPAGARQ